MTSRTRSPCSCRRFLPTSSCRIDDTPPIGPPRSGGEGELPADTPPLRADPGRPANGATRWRAQSATELVQQIDLADVLSALLGDATAQAADRRESALILSARVPGAIAMDPPANLDDLFWHRARVAEGFVDGRRDVVFPAEGLRVIPLTLPRRDERAASVSATLAATCDAVRTVPPVGPHPGVLPPEVAPPGARRVCPSPVHPRRRTQPGAAVAREPSAGDARCRPRPAACRQERLPR